MRFEEGKILTFGVEEHWLRWKDNSDSGSRLFGFLFGVVLAGSTAYYYVIDEYKVSNDMLTEDIYVRSARPNTASSTRRSVCHSSSGR